MNKVQLIGRLTRDPETRYSGDNCVARYTLAVDRRQRTQDGKTQADFISIVAFNKGGEFAEKYLHKGMKVAVTGRIQTGSYTNRDGQKVYTTDVIAEEQEFCESRRAESQDPAPARQQEEPRGEWMAIPDGVEDEWLPFN